MESQQSTNITISGTKQQKQGVCHMLQIVPTQFHGHLGVWRRNFQAQGTADFAYCLYVHMGMGQNLVPLVNIKIAGKCMFIPLKMVCIGIDP